jgi:hypothetical protein
MADDTSITDCNDSIENGIQQIALDEQHRVLVEFLRNNDEIKKVAKNSLQLDSIVGRRVMQCGAFVCAVGSVVRFVLGGLASGILALIGGFMSLIGFIISCRRRKLYDDIVQQIEVLETEALKSRLLDTVRDSLIDTGATLPISFASATTFRFTLNKLISHRTARDKIWKACMDVISVNEKTH